MAMLSFNAADFGVDHRDIEAQKRLLRGQMAGFGWLTPQILAHLDDTPDFYLDQVALVGAYLLAGELAAAGWDPEAGFAGYEARMRSFVEANQEIGRLNARSRDVPGPDTEPSPDFAAAGQNGVKLRCGHARSLRR